MNDMGRTQTKRQQFLDVQEVAELLHLKPRTIYSMVSQRRIPFRRAGRVLLFDLEEIENWTKECAAKR